MASDEIVGAEGVVEGALIGGTSASDQSHRILSRLAKRKEWIIPDAAFTVAPRVMLDVLEDEDADRREQIQASRTLVMMGNANTAVGSIDIRVNQALAVTTPPAAPEDVDIDVQPAFIESVVADDLAETVEVLESLGLMERYVEQVKTQTVIPSGNGNGPTLASGSGGKP